MRPTTRRRILLTTLVTVAIVALWEEPGGPLWQRRAPRRPFIAADVRNLPSVRKPEYLRVLFIGNSFTNYDGGQALIGRRLAEAALAQGRRARPPIFEQSTDFGVTLEWHWKHGEA